MDVVGPLPKTPSGMEYALVATDYLTRWVEVRAMRNKKSETVAMALLKIFGRMGVPRKLISDQGKEFISRSIRTVYQYLGIRRDAATPYHPETNGLTERFNRTLKDMISKIMMTTKIPWDEALEWAVGNYLAVPQKSTGESPFFLEKGRDPFMPLDALKNTPEPGYGRDIDNDANPVTNMPAFLAEMEKIAMDARARLS